MTVRLYLPRLIVAETGEGDRRRLTESSPGSSYETTR